MLQVHSIADRPDLRQRGIDAADVWPEYNMHGDNLNKWWGSLDERFAAFQFVIVDDEADEVVAEGHTAPLFWDGDVASLLSGIDEALERALEPAVDTPPANTLCAMAAEIPRQGRSRGLAAEILTAMRATAARHGLLHLIAPVRPSWKERYPLAPIDRYVTWRREDGQLIDPWMRVHERLGARVATTLPRSMLITGSVAEWEAWTAMQFPESGEYVFPEGLDLVHIDREADRGIYWEPNVWMIHPDITS